MTNREEVCCTITVFIVSKNLMFARGLESLVDQLSQFQVVGCETSTSRAIAQISDVQPDLILVDADGTLQQRPKLEQILHARSNMKVIGLSLQNNDLYIYQAVQRTVTGVDDLLDAIHEVANVGGKCGADLS